MSKNKFSKLESENIFVYLYYGLNAETLLRYFAFVGLVLGFKAPCSSTKTYKGIFFCKQNARINQSNSK
jgi:hypothetical protein